MNVLLTIDRFLREPEAFAHPDFAHGQPVSPVFAQVRLIVACGLVYGAAMGSFRGLAGEGWLQMLVSATKVPFLFLATFLLCIPSFYVLNALAGLAGDFPRVLNAILGFQALAAVFLATLAPWTGLVNLSTANYQRVVFWNGVVFAVASLGGMVRMGRLYRPLGAANRRHGLLLRVWVLLYWFVGIQMAWVLRPFVGDPRQPVQFFREEAWGNAYVTLLELIAHVRRN